MDDDAVQSAAAALLAAEESRVPIEPISITHPGATVEHAYAISARVTDLKVAQGRIVKGHKVGLTSKAMQDLVGSSEPDFGTIFADWFVDEGSTISMAELNRPLVELELAFVLAAGLRGPGVTTADVIAATSFVLPAIEIVDIRYRGRGSNLLVDSVADAASCGRIVLGACPVRLHDVDIRAVGASLHRNGAVVESGMSSAVMGSPVNAVAWLANKLSEFGVGLEAGQVVLSGSFIRAVPFGAGDTMTASFALLGDVTFFASE